MEKLYLFLTISMNEPQVAVRDIVHSTGEFFHQSNKEAILKQAAQILRNDANQFISNEKEKEGKSV